MIASKKSKLAAVAVVGTVLLGGGTAAVAATSASTPAGGTIHFFVNGNVKSETVQPIVITGAIGDYGTATSVTKTGKVNPNGNYEKIVLKKGSFKVNGVALDKKLNTVAPSLNASTCSLLFAGTGPATIFDGTGLYAGISGSSKITVTFAGIAPRLKSGKCDLKKQLAGYSTVTGVGKVKF